MSLGFPGLPRPPPDPTGFFQALLRVLNNILIGKLNVGGTVTLTANAGSTTLTDTRLGYQTAVILVPTTANAAAAIATTYISETSRVNGSVAITHANNAQTDKTFRYVLIG